MIWTSLLALTILFSPPIEPPVPATLPWHGWRVFTGRTVHVGVRPVVALDGREHAEGLSVRVSVVTPW